MKKTHEKKFYTTHEVAEIFAVTPTTIIQWCNAGKMKAFKTIGGHRRISKSALNEFKHKIEWKEEEDETTKNEA